MVHTHLKILATSCFMKQMVHGILYIGGWGGHCWKVRSQSLHLRAQGTRALSNFTNSSLQRCCFLLWIQIQVQFQKFKPLLKVYLLINLLFYVYECFWLHMYKYTTCMQSTEARRSPGSVTGAVHCCVGAENQAWVLCESSKCSYISLAQIQTSGRKMNIHLFKWKREKTYYVVHTGHSRGEQE